MNEYLLWFKWGSSFNGIPILHMISTKQQSKIKITKALICLFDKEKDFT